MAFGAVPEARLRVVANQQVAREGRKPRRIFRIFLVICAALIFSVAAFFTVKLWRKTLHQLQTNLHQSDFFRLAFTQVEIFPEERPGYLSPEHFLSYLKISEGDSLWALEPATLQANLQKHPWVKNAQVRRVFPNRMIFSVEVRQPIAMINARKLYFVDSEGVIFKAVDAQENKDFPLISGVAYSDFSRYPRAVHTGLVSAVALLKMIYDRFPVVTAQAEISEIRLEAVFPFKQLEDFSLEQEWDLSLILNPSGTVVRLGSEHHEERLLRFLRLVQDPQSHVQINSPVVFDVRFADRVVVSPLAPPTTESI